MDKNGTVRAGIASLCIFWDRIQGYAANELKSHHFYILTVTVENFLYEMVCEILRFDNDPANQS
jgi:hypothetical protein